ncbi:MAG: DAK2 domain-containing protein [Dermatophilaceae bacterium]
MSGEGRRLERLDSRAARRWAIATRAAFATHRAEIDELNVFPVPDRDTGTNLFMTLDSALEAAREAPRGAVPGVEPTLAGDAAALARACLLAARGNSGVILSQLVRGLSEVIGEAAGRGIGGMRGLAGGIDAPTLALAVRRASDRAYASVTRPVEGTILSVAAAAAAAAEHAVAAGCDLYAVVHASLGAARVALAATTAQLPSLSRAGVVDAGGMGYVLVLEALERVIAGELATDLRPGRGARTEPRTLPAASRECGHREPGGPAYEVMYLLSDSTEAAVSELRAKLDQLGDSVLVVGGEGLWNIHVHLDDVGAAVEAGIKAGRPHRIAVTHFGDSQRARAERSRGGAVAVVACAAGEGLAQVFGAAGAVVVPSRSGLRASAGQLLDAIRSSGARSVLVLPNDSDTELAAEAAAAAAGDVGLEVHVVPSQSAVQGIAALAVYEPTATIEDNLAAMSAAASATRYGSVTVAAKEAVTGAGPCRRGDVLGVVDGEVIVVGKDLAVVGSEVVAHLLAGGGELLTIVNGEGGGQALSAAVAASARQGGNVEVSIIDGGQARYPLLLGVE